MRIRFVEVLGFSSLVVALHGCGSERTRFGNDGGAADATAFDAVSLIPGIETLGRMCTGACGSADERKCTIGSDICATDLCLVDPASELINYCTIDCTSRSCPAGWRCEEVKAFGHDDVTRACVAEPATCGDGITQLGEVCDGDDPSQGRCVDCARFEPICGDGVLQGDEVCDGDTAEEYCVSCARFMRPTFSVTTSNWNAMAVESVEGPTTTFSGAGVSEYTMLGGEVPQAGDANGCGAVRVLETTNMFTRLEWTWCGEFTTARAIWRFSIPRTEADYNVNDGDIPTEFAMDVTLEQPDVDREVSWTMEDVQRFEVRTWQVVGDRTSTNIDVRFEHPDSIQSFSTDEARFNATFEMTHPPLLSP